MKKLFVVSVILFIANMAIGQSFPKEGLVSVHTLILTPKAGVNMSDLVNFIEQKSIPAWEKEFECKIHLLKGLNRDNENKDGMVYYYKSKKVFNKYWNDDGSPTELGKAGMKKLGSITKEMNLLGTIERKDVRDWILE